jgi:hypothetical protein
VKATVLPSPLMATVLAKPLASVLELPDAALTSVVASAPRSYRKTLVYGIWVPPDWSPLTNWLVAQVRSVASLM